MSILFWALNLLVILLPEAVLSLLYRLVTSGRFFAVPAFFQVQVLIVLAAILCLGAVYILLCKTQYFFLSVEQFYVNSFCNLLLRTGLQYALYFLWPRLYEKICIVSLAPTFLVRMPATMSILLSAGCLLVLILLAPVHPDIALLAPIGAERVELDPYMDYEQAQNEQEQDEWE